MRFDPTFPVEKLVAAEYNPRQLSAAAAARLRASLQHFGVIKPVIVNNVNNVLVAGHQRTATATALGFATIPAIVLDAVARGDEVQFNLFHNSIETNKSTVRLPVSPTNTFAWTAATDIDHDGNANPAIVDEICRLLVKYGTWGSVVCDADGNVVDNSDYAIACAILRQPCLAYTLKTDAVDEYRDICKTNFGTYYYRDLDIPSYKQVMVQPRRNADEGVMKSSLYERYVIDWLTDNPQARIVDFGSGNSSYAQMLQRRGFHVLPYEPHLPVKGKHAIDIKNVIGQIRALQHDIEANGLYDAVVLDSVLNAVVSPDMHHNVLTAANSLLKPGGRLFVSTRSRIAKELLLTATRKVEHRRQVMFWDDDGWAGNYKEGVWNMMRFYYPAQLERDLSTYFEHANVVDFLQRQTMLYAMCDTPLPLAWPQREKALDVEFNMAYPQGYRHNRHGGLLAAIRACHENNGK